MRTAHSFDGTRIECWCIAAFLALMTGCASATSYESCDGVRLDTVHSRNGQKRVLNSDQVLALIGASPKLERETFDPQALLVAANVLTRLGKVSATRLLRQFIDSVAERASAGKCQYNEVTRVIPLALVLKEPSSGPFECVKGAWLYDGVSLTQEPWHEFPLAIVDDIPFLVALPSGGSSPEEVATMVVEELKQSGVRMHPLCPRSMPTTACTKLLRGGQWSAVASAVNNARSLEYMEALVRKEALLALRDLYPAHIDFDRAASEGRKYDWETHWAAVRGLAVQWDADRDVFCVVQ
jgi:hypothetical protein